MCLLPSTLAAQDPAPNGAQNVDPRLTYDVHIVMIHLPDLTVAMDCVAKWWRKGRKLRVEFAGGPMSLVALRDGNADCVLLPSQRKAIRFVGREAPAEERSTQAELLDVLWSGLLGTARDVARAVAASSRVLGTEQIGPYTCQVIEQSGQTSQGLRCRFKEWRATVDGSPVPVRRIGQVGDMITVESVSSVKPVPDLADDLFGVPPGYTIEEVQEDSFLAMSRAMRELLAERHGPP